MPTGVIPNHVPGRRRPAVIASLTVAMAVVGCAGNTARVASGVPTDLAGTAPAGLGTPPPLPVDARFDGAYVGTLAPDVVNPPGCGATPDGLSRTMLVSNGHASLGVNVPFEGQVEPDGHVAMTYLAVGDVHGRFLDDAFAGVLRTGSGLACRWAVGLARLQSARPARTGESPAPEVVPGPPSLLNGAASSNPAVTRRPDH